MLTVPTCLGGTLQMLAIMLLLCFAPMFTFIIIIIMVTQHIPTMTKSHHGGELSVMMKVGMCQCQKPTIHHDELYFGVYMYIR